ncbi:MAG TPA: hypothetical protein VLA49_08795 [Anaerolineales bacterium]|nr:hypothetical protein [Anaerolineales bacterium]
MTPSASHLPLKETLTRVQAINVPTSRAISPAQVDTQSDNTNGE